MLLIFLLSGCVTVEEFLSGGPYPSKIGGAVVSSPKLQNFRGLPVVRVSFLASADTGAEAALAGDYKNTPIYFDLSSYEDDQTGLNNGPGAGATIADDVTARANLKAMFAKNAFYAFHLVKFLKIKSKGDFTVVLNPLKLKHTSTGYYYDPFEKNMPPHDIDIHFLSYVHPNTKPSTKNVVITTFGESLAPIVSIRMDPKFNPKTEGAVALTDGFVEYAQNKDDSGLRAQLIDQINAKHYQATTANTSARLADLSLSSGEFKTGHFYTLSLGTKDMETTGVPENIIPEADLSGKNYDPGTYYAYKFYNAYYRIVMAALNKIDNRKFVTAAQKNFWEQYDANDVSEIMLQKTDPRKRRFLMALKKIELEYLENRDTNWIEAVLSGNKFKSNFNKLRSSEQQARDAYVAAQIQAAAGILLAVGGAYVSARSSGNNSYGGTVAGGAAFGLGLGLMAKALADIKSIDVGFGASFDLAYDSQKSYIFETADGEKESVSAKDYTDFRRQLKSKYDQRFEKETKPVS